MSLEESTSSPTRVSLTEADIPGAALEEPFEKQNMEALRWWLLCRGIKLPMNANKKTLITRFVIYFYIIINYYTVCFVVCVCM